MNQDKLQLFPCFYLTSPQKCQCYQVFTPPVVLTVPTWCLRSTISSQWPC